MKLRKKSSLHPPNTNFNSRVHSRLLRPLKKFKLREEDQDLMKILTKPPFISTSREIKSS